MARGRPPKPLEDKLMPISVYLPQFIIDKLEADARKSGKSGASMEVRAILMRYYSGGNVNPSF